MKRTVTVSVNAERASALEMYLVQKNTTLAAELEKFIAQAYAKYVPQNVREYIEMSERKPERKPRRRAARADESGTPNEDSGADADSE